MAYVVACIVYKGLLDSIYLRYVWPLYQYKQHTLSYNPEKILSGFVLVTLLSILFVGLTGDSKRPSRFAITIYFVMVVIPVISLYGLQDAPTPFVLGICMGFAILTIAVRLIRVRVKFPLAGVGVQRAVLLGLLFMSLYVFAFLFYTRGISGINFNLNDVYELRSRYSLAGWPLMSYLVLWQAHVINMLALVHSYHVRSYAGVAVVIAIQLLLFGLTNFKSFLLAPVLVLWVYRFNEHRSFAWMLVGGAGVVSLVGIGLYELTGDTLYVGLFSRRLLFAPAQNHLYYFEFFNKNEFVLLSNSVLSPFIDYPYTERIPHIIMSVYYGGTGGANVGLLGDAFAQFGYFGLVLFPVAAAIVFALLDNLAYVIDRRFVTAASVIPMVAMVNSALFTTMLTHGLLFCIILLWAYSGWVRNIANPLARRIAITA